MKPYSVEELRERHIPGCMRLKTIAGWNQREDDWRDLMSLGKSGSFVALSGDDVVGSVTLASYDYTDRGSLGWIGMVLVHPDFRRRGIATALVEMSMAAATDVTVFGLDATEAGSPVYERLGFSGVCTVNRYVRSDSRESDSIPERPIPVRPIPVSSFLPEQLGKLISFDARVGIRREPLLRALISRAPDLSACVETGAGFLGFALGRLGTDAAQIGPVVAADTETFGTLLDEMLGRVEGRVYIDVPELDGAVRGCLESRGFEITRTFLRMFCGSHLPGDEHSRGLYGRPLSPEIVSAVTGPEFG